MALYDIGTASFTQSFDVSSQDAFPQDLAWNNDGSKLYVVGNSNNNVYEYSVSTPYDVSTASFSQSLDVSGQDTTPSGLAWNNDGSKLYVVGSANDSVYEYSVSTPYDVSTASFSQSLDVSGQDTNPRGLVWNGDGSKLYVVGTGNDSVYEYSVSTPYDVSTASFSQSLDVSGQDTGPSGLAWNNDGSKLYVVGLIDDSVYEYSVSTPYDVSTASFSQSLDVLGQDNIPQGLAWNNDGSKLYVIGDGNDSVYEYSLPVSVSISDWDGKNSASVGTLSDSTSFTGLTKVQPVKVTWGNASSSTGSGDAAFTFDIDSQSELVVTESDESTVRPYEVESFDDTAQEAWLWVYGSWDSDGSDQIVVGAGTGDGTDYSMSGSGVNPWGSSGVNAAMVQHLNEGNYPTDNALDSSPNGNDGTVTGATSTSGEVDGAASFDGVDDKITFTDSNSIDLLDGDDFSYGGWIKIETTQLNNTGLIDGGLIGKRKQKETNDGWQSYIDYDGASTVNVGVTLRNNSGTAYNIGAANNNGPDIADGEWYLFFATLNNSTSTFELFIDNVSVDSATVSGSFDNNNDVNIAEDFQNQEYTQGSFGSIRIFKQNITQTWMQAEIDASPKGSQTFFSWNGETVNGSTSISSPVSQSSGTTVNPALTPGTALVSTNVTQASSTTPNPVVFSDQFISSPVSTGNAVNPNPVTNAGLVSVTAPASTSLSTAPNPAISRAGTVITTVTQASASTPNPAVVGGGVQINPSISQSLGTTPNPGIRFSQFISARVSTGNAVNPNPVTNAGPISFSATVSKGSGTTVNPGIRQVISQNTQLIIGLDAENIYSIDLDAK